MAPDHRNVTAHVGAILNAGYMVRHYPRPGQRALRATAIRALGLAVRAAFNESEDFETLLTAVLDAVTSGERPRF